MVAGELSGDLLGGSMLSQLRLQLPDARIHGIGGPQMQAYGFESDFPLDKLSVRGLFEVLAHYREIKGIQRALQAQLIKEQPSVFVGIDAPDFNTGLELALRQSGIPTVHYVGPSIWNWRRGRIKKIKEAVSHMLVLFPFEEQLYVDAGVPVTYVGHPLAQTIPMDIDVAAARKSLAISEKATVVTVMLGSRISELNYHLAPFLGAVDILHKRDPHIEFVLPMAGERQEKHFNMLVKQQGWQDLPLRVVLGETHPAIAASDAVLVASGTATLEVALFKKPMVVSYKLMWATWQILYRMQYEKRFALPNILLKEFVVPEIMQDEATPQKLAEAVWEQLSNENNRVNLKARFTELHETLLRDTASLSANAVLDVIRK